MTYVLAPFGIGLILIFIGRKLWSKGNPEESIGLAIISWIVDMAIGHFPSSIRTLAILFHFIGSVAILVAVMRIIKLF